jgi:GNAT superfamily N-acetyltransferase
MIHRCDGTEFDEILTIINDGAQAYKGVIAEDQWRDPYMSKEELRHEIDAGVAFSGYGEAGGMLGVMGFQHVQDVVLIRHAYIRATGQRQGIGTALLLHLLERAKDPVLIGTWADATWAIRFYQKLGFRTVVPAEKDRLLRKYWDLPERQIATSVVLARPDVP